MLPVDFEKDDDLNHHIDWIMAATNMRSFNYSIAPSQRNYCRVTAGRIIPAIATTTASITGFVGVEILKYVLGLTHTTQRNTTINLATNNTVIQYLDDPRKTTNKYEVRKEEKDGKKVTIRELVSTVMPPTGFTIWDKVVIQKGDLTVEGMLAALADAFPKTTCDSFFQRGITDKDIKEGKGRVLYRRANPFAGTYNMAKMMLRNSSLNPTARAKFQEQVAQKELWDKSVEATLPRKVSDLYVEYYGALVTPERNYVLLDGNFSNDDGLQVLVPTIKYVFK